VIRRQLSFQVYDELFIDNFAGGGGASTGIERALGRPIDHALNHDRKALAMHRMNHPTTKHHPEDIRHADPLKIAGERPVGGIWFSPDCKHHSKARGGKPRDKKIRGLAWSVIHWVNVLSKRKAKGPRVIYLENVEEFAQWCPLDSDDNPSKWRKAWYFICFTGALMRRGFHDIEWAPGDGFVYRRTRTGIERVEGVTFSSRACDYSTPTIRKRLYLIARCDGRHITWPEQTHAEPTKAKKLKLKPHKITADYLNFSLPCPSIFLTRAEAREFKKRTGIQIQRPLAHATMARIAKGVKRYVLDAKKPFIVELTHEGNDGVASVDDPIKTITAANRGEKSLVVPTVVGCGGRAAQSRPRGADEAHATTTSKADACLTQATLAPFVTEHANASTQRNFPINEPARTQCAEVKGGHFAAVAPYLVPRYGERKGQEPRTRSVEQPAPVIVPTGNGGSLAAVHLTKFQENSIGQTPAEPIDTIMAGATRFGMITTGIVKMHGDPASHAPGHAADEPIHTINAEGNHHVLFEGKLHRVTDIRIPTFEEWFALTKAHGGTREEYDALYSADGEGQREFNRRVAAYIAQHNGGAAGHQTVGHPLDKPLSTLSSKCSQQQVVGASLVPYYGSEEDSVGLNEPCRTVTTRDRFGLTPAFGATSPLPPHLEAGARRVAAFLREHGIEFEGDYATVGDYIIVDIGMRMLKPRELYCLQGFPVNYIIDRGLDEDDDGRVFEIKLNGTEQVRMCGNSVCPPMAEVLVAANNPEMRFEELAA
jgi:DNA (cytosine-5)-methyltransferase 1